MNIAGIHTMYRTVEGHGGAWITRRIHPGKVGANLFTWHHVIELFFIKGIEVFPMKRRLIVFNDRQRQEQDIFVKLVEHSLHRCLLLNKPIFKKKPSSAKTRIYSCKFLYQCLVNRFFLVPKDEAIPTRYLLRRRHHSLKRAERFL